MSLASGDRVVKHTVLSSLCLFVHFFFLLHIKVCGVLFTSLLVGLIHGLINSQNPDGKNTFKTKAAKKKKEVGRHCCTL